MADSVDTEMKDLINQTNCVPNQSGVHVPEFVRSDEVILGINLWSPKGMERTRSQ